MDGIEDGCMIYRLIVIKHKGVFLLQNRENRSQLTGIINPNKSCFGLESRPSNKNICKDIESIIGQGTLITKENVHNQDIVVGQLVCGLVDKTFTQLSLMQKQKDNHFLLNEVWFGRDLYKRENILHP